MAQPTIEYAAAISNNSWPSNDDPPPPNQYHMKFSDVPVTASDRLLVMINHVRDSSPIGDVQAADGPGPPPVYASQTLEHAHVRHNIRQPSGTDGNKAQGRGVHVWLLRDPPVGTANLPFRVGYSGSPDKSGRGIARLYVIAGANLDAPIRDAQSEEHYKFDNDLANNPGANSISVAVETEDADDLVIAAASAQWVPPGGEYDYPLTPVGEGLANDWELDRGPAVPDGGSIWGAGFSLSGAASQVEVTYKLPGTDLGSLVLVLFSIRPAGDTPDPPPFVAARIPLVGMIGAAEVGQP